jgi:exosortase C (VPDSG-CTERM-specific)
MVGLRFPEMQPNSQPDASTCAPPRQPPPTPSNTWRLRAAFLSAIIIGVAFAIPLHEYVHVATTKERNTHLLLVPLISGYLIWARRRELRAPFGMSIPGAAVAVLCGGIALLAIWPGIGPAAQWPERLSVEIFALICFLFASCFLFIGASVMREIAFPLAFAAFAIPVPLPIVEAIETFLQYASAEAAALMLTISQVPMLRNGVDFQFPGIRIRVAQECSGYNSSFALFLVSLLAGHFFLRTPWRKFALTAAVIPLAILRNGFRITTISLLCVYIDPTMIESYIHRQGGPIFFALSLIPFLALLWWLRKSEIGKSRKAADQALHETN